MSVTFLKPLTLTFGEKKSVMQQKTIRKGKDINTITSDLAVRLNEIRTFLRMAGMTLLQIAILLL